MHWIPEIHIFYVDKSSQVIVVWSSLYDCVCFMQCEQLSSTLTHCITQISQRVVFQRIQAIRIQSTPLNAICRIFLRQENSSKRAAAVFPSFDSHILIFFDILCRWKIFHSFNDDSEVFYAIFEQKMYEISSLNIFFLTFNSSQMSNTFDECKWRKNCKRAGKKGRKISSNAIWKLEKFPHHILSSKLHDFDVKNFSFVSDRFSPYVCILVCSWCYCE